MKKMLKLWLTLLLLAACSVEVSEQAATAQPVATGLTADAPATVAAPVWSELNLSGQLIFMAFQNQQQKIFSLELNTGEQTILFEVPEGDWLTDIAVSPDGRQIVLAYATQSQFGLTDLYLMPADGSAEPALLLERSLPSETYYQVSWPSEAYIYYAHSAPKTGDLGELIYVSQIERYHLAEEKVEVIAERATWPRVSSDGTKLAYVTDSNEIVIAEADGENPLIILESAAFPAVDAPLFSPDGDSLYFSAIDPEEPSPLSFLDRLLGVKVALAHDVPSDWWRIAVDGSGEAERLTSIYKIGMYGDFGPDEEHIAFITSDGLQVMDPDGSGLFQLNNMAATGSLTWVNSQ